MRPSARISVAVAAVFLLGGAAPAAADAVADFYKGRTLTLAIGYSPGASYDTYGRLLARHWSRHIPGRPNIVVQNMPGGSSLKAANYLYNVAPKDGATVGLIRNGLALEPLYGRGGVKFDALKFNWIGSLTRITGACTLWHTAPARTLLEARDKEVVVGAIGSQGSLAVYPRALNDMLGTKFKVVLGYTSKGILLAMERGEVHGRCGGDWNQLAAEHRDWVQSGKIVLVAQMTNTKHPDLQDKPWIFDFVKKSEDVQALRLIFATQDWGMPVVAPPGVPMDRVTALRAAFNAAMKDPALTGEAGRMKLNIHGPMRGEEIQSALAGYYKTPKAIIERVAAYGKPGKGERRIQRKGAKSK